MFRLGFPVTELSASFICKGSRVVTMNLHKFVIKKNCNSQFSILTFFVEFKENWSVSL